jgi:hypothetical protein
VEQTMLPTNAKTLPAMKNHLRPRASERGPEWIGSVSISRKKTAVITNDCPENSSCHWVCRCHPGISYHGTNIRVDITDYRRCRCDLESARKSAKAQ